ncbi:hypothetical protein CI109_107260 [Kwoniella shandongensis]|uniref:Uncharacterized protein n=1 Tax=Kwoniella shandongensis TaxID=1734106 RepID=A0A5M6C376_9TREE|nr:uncharacterized protein CI109_002542 [Kwoniella shandongensis]KAA5529201.1 hypothetical protein CI109_002542 [Kwoniella shandongensis]
MDDLLDLNWSSPTTTKTSSTPPINATAPAPQKQSTAFDFLAQPAPRAGTPNYYGSSSTPLRASTPSQPLANGGVGGQRLGLGAAGAPPLRGSGTTTPLGSGFGTPTIPQGANSNGGPNPSASASGAGGSVGLDAFSSLLSISSSGSATGGKNMTMAEKQAALADEKKRKAEEDRKRFEAEGAFWDNLGGGSGTKSQSTQKPNGLNELLGPPPPIAGPSTSRVKSPVNDGILAPSPAPGTSSKPKTSTANSAGSFWNHFDDTDDLLTSSAAPRAKPPSATSRSPAPPSDPFDFDALAAVPSHLSVNGSRNGGSGPGSGMRTPVSDFDFGDRGDDDEEDILGDLGKPVTARPTSAQAESGPSRAPKRTTHRSSSPPPHIVGQIVEMGFSPAQARQALSKTSDGLDVQAAMEILLSGGGGSSSNRQQPREDPTRQNDFSGEEDDEERIEYLRKRREEEEKERRRRRRAGPSRDSVRARTQDEREQETQTPMTAAQAQEQAEKILAQASEIGQNMFSKATSFWNVGKEKALKVYEEQRKALEAQAQAGGEGGGGARKQVRTDGRPKWMVDAEAAQAGEWRGGADDGEAGGGFRDDDDEDAAVSPPRHARAGGSARPTPNGAGPSRQRPAANASERTQSRNNESDIGQYRSPKERADLLFADEEPKRYVSPARHRKPVASSASAAPRAAAAAASPKPLPARQLVSASLQQIQTSAAHKAKGNEHFKLGRFAEADSAYTSAISALPEGHLFLVPLHNNRAAARLKLGDSAPAAADCTVAINLIGPTYHPSKEAPLPGEVASEVKLGDGLVKAMIKRAQAWEMGEKWKNAVEDWERLMSMDMAILGNSATATRNLAAEGARRARKMMDDGGNNNSSSTSSTANTKAKPKIAPKPVAPSKPSDVESSAAVADLRKAAQAAEKEDEQRHLIKDTIDAKLNAWKGGKESNLRALIASLDTVLWDEILKGGLKVGMHELITEKQVKIKYMKVIARLHPDKLNTQNTTVEQRMLANGAFGALSEAWQAFSK